MSDSRQEFLARLIKGHVPEGPERDRALEEVGLMGMQADRDSARIQESRMIPEYLKGPKAAKAVEELQTAFRSATGMNIFDTRSEDLVRATWGVVHAVVTDERNKLSEGYRNTGIHDTPDLDAVTALDEMLEIPGTLGSILWGK